MIRVRSLGRNHFGGINVYLDPQMNPNRIVNVHENIVRCALGDEDMEYLLSKRSTNHEHAFTITESDFEDFKRYKAH